MNKILISDVAQLDVKDAYKWYASRDKSIAEKFKTSLLNSFKLINDTPLLFPLRKNYRVAQVLSFPFEIYFQIREQHSIIIAVFHTSRNPDVLSER